MKKFYLFAAMLISCLSVSAQGTMTDENETLKGMGYRLEKDVNWYEGTLNGTPFYNESYVYGSGNECLEYVLPASTTIKVNSYSLTSCKNEGMEWFYVQTYNETAVLGNIICSPGSKGLYSTKNERWIALSGLRANQIIAIDISNQDAAQFVPNSTACNNKTGWADTMTDPLQVVEITDSIHSLQELAGGEGTADTYRYFRVNPENNTTEGWMYAKFNGKTPNSIWRMQIWSDNKDAEVVSAPVYSMKGVDGTARWIRVKDGVSTFNNPVKTYYSKDGSEPLYLEDTEEIDHYEPIIDPETGDTIGQEPVYKKEAKKYEGEWGDYLYDSSLGEEAYVTLDASDDEDGDGWVTLKTRSITEDGIFSEISEQNYEIGTIVLNAPTLSLTGMDGTDRSYIIGWTNNTLCGEDFDVTVDIDGSTFIGQYTVGDVVTANETLSVTVNSTGYESATTAIAVEQAGTEFYKKGDSATWDFVNFSQEQSEKLGGKYITGAILVVTEGEKSDTTWYTREEYLNGETPDDVEEVYGWYGWDGIDTRQAGRHWQTLLKDSTIVTGSEGQDSLVYTFTYAEDQTGLFHDGFIYENSIGGAYPNNYSATAIFVNDPSDTSVNHGIYNNTSHVYITVPDVRLGEYVMYTLSTGSVCEPAQATETESGTTYGYYKDLGKNVFLWYVTIFTTNDLPDVIDNVAARRAATSTARFNLSGQQVDAGFKGIVIKDGKKMLVK